MALVLAAVAGPSLWLQRNVVDQDGFVALAGPLGGDKEFQESLTTLLSGQAAASLNLPSFLNKLAVEIINSAAQNIYSDPGYPQAWSETLQRSHALTFAAAGKSEVAEDLQLDLAPLVDLVAAKVTADVGATVPIPKEVVVGMEQPQIARALPLAVTLGGWSGWMVFIAVDLLALGVIVARRRALTVVASGVGLGIVALLWLLASGAAQRYLSALVLGPGSATQIGAQVAELARDSWQGGITLTFVLAGVVAAVGVASLVVGRRRTT
ncbi:hypothetical protein [Arthrobacter sp.]|uniref:hypothetical protein n=1 Tax=Arthrobacter sp. TaxID=1667 RepID=UPI0026E038B3|nr:hypothetical protein [Arthrobacter sp.]MDO5753562.1 hypothetical protein [Arthrobacter sp.]